MIERSQAYSLYLYSSDQQQLLMDHIRPNFQIFVLATLYIRTFNKYTIFGSTPWQTKRCIRVNEKIKQEECIFLNYLAFQFFDFDAFQNNLHQVLIIKRLEIVNRKIKMENSQDREQPRSTKVTYARTVNFNSNCIDDVNIAWSQFQNYYKLYPSYVLTLHCVVHGHNRD